jgi:hypothetical protein
VGDADGCVGNVLALRLALAVAALSTTTLTACSSCPIEGQYLYSGTVTQGNCGPIESSLTISKATDFGGAEYFVQLGGQWAGCPGTSDGACKLEVDCKLTLSDATNPSDSVATLHLSLTMSSGGFTGSEEIYVPPSASFAGCSGSELVGGTRN